MIPKVMLRSLLCNAFLTIIKIGASFFSNSKTMLADAVHCASDLTTDVVGLIGSKLSLKEPDDAHPYGHGKLEYVTSIIISFFIIVLGITIFKNSFEPKITKNLFIVFITLIITIIIKFIISSYLISEGKKYNSNILISSGTESRFDTLSSFFACLFLIITMLGAYYKPLHYADVIGSIVISVLTIKIGVKLLIENINSVIGEKETDKEIYDKIDEVLNNYKVIKEVRRVTIIKYGTYYQAHIDICSDKNIILKKLYSMEKKVKEDIKKSNTSIRFVNIEVKPLNE